MKKYLFYIGLLLIGCNKQDNSIYVLKLDSFEKVYLQGEQILKNDITAESIYEIGDFILTKQVSESESHFKIYDKKTLDFIGDFGDKDKNIQSTLFLSFQHYEVNKDHSVNLKLFNFIKGEFSIYNISRNLINDSINVSIENKFNINPDTFSANQIFMINDSILVGNTGNFDIESDRIKKINLNTNEIIKSGQFPNALNTNLLPFSDIRPLYNSHIGVNIYKNKFISSMEHFDRIDFFDINMNVTKSIVHGDVYSDGDIDVLNLDYKGDNPLDKLTIFYFDIVVKEKYIYALYYNQLEENYGNPQPVEIRVFDLNGNPKYLLQIPEYLINISVDEEEGYIYGSAFFEEKIMRYKINL